MMMEEAARKAVAYGKKFVKQGKAADYIPELKKADPEEIGLCIAPIGGKRVLLGDAEKRFTIQSISKVVTLVLALETFGTGEVFSHVMMEPTGDAFNSIIKLDTVSNRPYNPMINAGAIEVVSLLAPKFRFEEMLSYTRKLCSDDGIRLNEDVYQSEFGSGSRNRAIGYLLESKGVLSGNVSEIMDLYFKMCSLSVNAVSLANMAGVLAHGGVDPDSGKRRMQPYTARVVKTLMLTCGMYDGSGEFAVRVGIPAKSGVGGGIMACAEDRLGIGTYGPALDKKGNSIGGVRMLEVLSDLLGLHIFDTASGQPDPSQLQMENSY